MLLWVEFKELHPDTYEYTQFVRYYRQWEQRCDLVMRQEHRAGQRLLVLAAVEQSLAAGAYDFAAVFLCLRGDQEPERPEALPLRLVREPLVPVPDCGPYHQLLGQEAD